MDIFPYFTLCFMSPTPPLSPPLPPPPPPSLKLENWSRLEGGEGHHTGCASWWSEEPGPLENDSRWSPPPRFGARTVETCFPLPVCLWARPCPFADPSSDSCRGAAVFTGKLEIAGAWYCGWTRGERVKHRLPRDRGHFGCIVLVP